MSAAAPDAERGAFTRGSAAALVAAGFAVFLALVYLIGSGDSFAARGNDGEAHAAANGLNGYAGLARLLDAEGYDVVRSRSPAGFDTAGLLVLTPPAASAPEDIAEILEARAFVGPTLVIMPKWNAVRPPPSLPPEAAAKFRRGWVALDGARTPGWSEALPAPFGFGQQLEVLVEQDERPGWEGFGLAGDLPTRTILHAENSPLHEPLVVDSAGHWLALKVLGEPDSEYYESAHWTIFVSEPDLVNNYGLADAARAAAALALVREASYNGDITEVTFDLTLNGHGASVNLLTLAFRRPFLAATLCLLLALLIIGWRAFRRFGPPAVSAPAIPFGKRRLIDNGAGLIVRANRLRLLAGPYAALSARRLAHALGLPRAEPQAIDAALARRLPDDTPFSQRAARLAAAERPADILSAAQALDELTRKVKQ